jgi:hypothetical protein
LKTIRIIQADLAYQYRFSGGTPYRYPSVGQRLQNDEHWLRQIASRPFRTPGFDELLTPSSIRRGQARTVETAQTRPAGTGFNHDFSQVPTFTKTQPPRAAFSAQLPAEVSSRPADATQNAQPLDWEKTGLAWNSQLSADENIARAFITSVDNRLIAEWTRGWNWGDPNGPRQYFLRQALSREQVLVEIMHSNRSANWESDAEVQQLTLELKTIYDRLAVTKITSAEMMELIGPLFRHLPIFHARHKILPDLNEHYVKLVEAEKAAAGIKPSAEGGKPVPVTVAAQPPAPPQPSAQAGPNPPADWERTGIPWDGNKSYIENVIRAFTTEISQATVDEWTRGHDFKLFNSPAAEALRKLNEELVSDYERNHDSLKLDDDQPTTVKLRLKWLRQLYSRTQTMQIEEFITRLNKYGPIKGDIPLILKVLDFNQWQTQKDFSRWTFEHYTSERGIKSFFTYFYKALPSDRKRQEVVQQLIDQASAKNRQYIIAYMPLNSQGTDLSLQLESLIGLSDLVGLRQAQARLDQFLTSENTVSSLLSRKYHEIHTRVTGVLKVHGFGLNPQHPANLDVHYKGAEPEGWNDRAYLSGDRNLEFISDIFYRHISFYQKPYAHQIAEAMMTAANVGGQTYLQKLAQPIDWVTPGSPGYQNFQTAAKEVMEYLWYHSHGDVSSSGVQRLLNNIFKIPATMEHIEIFDLYTRHYSAMAQGILEALAKCDSCVTSPSFGKWMEKLQGSRLSQSASNREMLESLELRRRKAVSLGLIRAPMSMQPGTPTIPFIPGTRTHGSVRLCIRAQAR